MGEQVRFNNACDVTLCFGVGNVFCFFFVLSASIIEKQFTDMRAPIPVKERLSITLNYLATGTNMAIV